MAYEAHVAGILFAFGYYRFHWNLGALLPSAANFLKLPCRLAPRPKLKLHAPGEEAPPPNMEAEVDRILAKIHASGNETAFRPTNAARSNEPAPAPALISGAISRVRLRGGAFAPIVDVFAGNAPAKRAKPGEAGISTVAGPRTVSFF